MFDHPFGIPFRMWFIDHEWWCGIVILAAVEIVGGDIAYTEYPGVDHNSWDQTYRDAAVIAWMLAQRR